MDMGAVAAWAASPKAACQRLPASRVIGPEVFRCGLSQVRRLSEIVTTRRWRVFAFAPLTMISFSQTSFQSSPETSEDLGIANAVHCLLTARSFEPLVFKSGEPSHKWRLQPLPPSPAIRTVPRANGKLHQSRLRLCDSNPVLVRLFALRKTD